jgi:hypothetical protein
MPMAVEDIPQGRFARICTCPGNGLARDALARLLKDGPWRILTPVGPGMRRRHPLTSAYPMTPMGNITPQSA